MQSTRGAAVVLLALLLIQAASARDLQQVALPSAFPGADTGDETAAPTTPAATTPSPTSTSPSTSPAASSPAAATSPSPAAAKAPAPAPAKAPAPAPAAATPAPAPAPTAGAPSTGAPAPGPATGAAPAPGPAAATAGAPAPAGAAIATGGGDSGNTTVIYIQQAGNVQMTSSPSDPNSGTMFMNNALDTTLYDQDYPIRKLGKTSTTNFINAGSPSNGTGAAQWFAPAPQAVLLGFNTTYNVYLLLTLSAPVYNFTTNTLAFNYLLQNPGAAKGNTATNGYVANYYINATDSGVLPVTSINSQLTLFTPSLFYTIPCSTTDTPVPIGSCTTSRKGACANGAQGVWKEGTFCA